MDIIDELTDRERRKRNIIVYNLSESSPNNKADSDAFAVLCSSVYNSSLLLLNLCVWERKILTNIDHYYYPCKRKKINLSYFLALSFYIVMTFTRMYFKLQT